MRGRYVSRIIQSIHQSGRIVVIRLKNRQLRDPVARCLMYLFPGTIAVPAFSKRDDLTLIGETRDGLTVEKLHNLLLSMPDSVPFVHAMRPGPQPFQHYVFCRQQVMSRDASLVLHVEGVANVIVSDDPLYSRTVLEVLITDPGVDLTHIETAIAQALALKRVTMTD